ncbi:NAD-dependent epimerase/dehydratase family protein [Muriicola sp.]|uniref:NAD-dependent epimerase/dehydratase family protein n=1 Tax=Muriicola sp. TaxID=2020856 RepID=UPI003C77A8BC
MKPHIGVLGCGWLGFPLAKRFISMDFRVSGTTTTKANLDILGNEGIVPYYVELHNEGVQGSLINFLKDIDILIINVPPRRKAMEEDYLNKMTQLYEASKIMHLKKIIFVSSTSVYGEVQGEVTERSVLKPGSDSAKQLVAAEKLFMGDKDMEATIVRFGGLLGPDRHPVTYLAGQHELSNGDDAINLIHIDDCVLLLTSIVTNEWWGKLMNGVYPDHPTKRIYYTKEATKRGLPVPVYTKGYAGKTGKIVKTKTLDALKFKFMNPIDSHS